MHIGGIILAGGKSSRMGTNKSLLTIDNQPVIKRIAEELQTCTNEVIVIANDPSTYKFLQVRQFGDRYFDKGPLAGLEAALYYVDADAYVISACDMPFINKRIYNYLLDRIDHYDAVVPVYDNRIHPLAGVYKRTVLPKIQQQLEKDDRKVKGFFDHIKVKYIRDFTGIPKYAVEKHFFNMNNPDQYKKAMFLSCEINRTW